MLSSKVLMVGNITKDINGEYYTVKATSFENVANNTLTLFGVPLTAEILIKFGFIKSNSYTRWRLDTERSEYYIFGNKLGDYTFGIHDMESGIQYFAWNIKYVHQLQNLLHSLGHPANLIL